MNTKLQKKDVRKNIQNIVALQKKLKGKVKLMSDLASDRNIRSHLYKIVGDNNVSSETLDAILEIQDLGFLGHEIARHDNLSIQTLKKLIHSKDPYILEGLVQNKNIMCLVSEFALEQIIFKLDTHIIQKLVENRHLSSDFLHRFSKHRDSLVRKNVAMNINTKRETRCDLLNDECFHVAYEARKRL